MSRLRPDSDGSALGGAAVPPGPPLATWPPPNPPGAGAEPVAPAPDSAPRPWAVAALSDLSAVVAWYAVAATLGALVWWQLTPLAEFTRTAGGGSMDELQLTREVSSDGWFFVVALCAGLISGIGLTWWRGRDPLLIVVLVAAGAFLATWLMLLIGQQLGPDNPDKVLATVPLGAKVPLQLKIQSSGLWFTWAIAALVGAIGVIWGTERN